MSTFDVNFIENQDMDVEFDPDDELDVGFGGMRMVDYNDQVYHKPSIEGVELVGDVSLDDLGVAYAEDIPTDVSELINDAGYITASAIPPIPSKTSDLLNNSGFITEDDIPPLVTDLGVVDPEPYDDDVSVFLNTLTESGWYKFFWDSGDDYSYFAQVQSIDYGDAIFVNQHCWGLEESPITEWVRGIIVEDGEVVSEESSSYMTFDAASNAFAMKTHTHYRTDSKAVSVWDYCDGSQIKMQNGSPILYTDTLNNRQYVIETWQAIRQPTYNYQKVTDLMDSSVFYQRSGFYQGGVTHWGDWEYIGSLKITVNGTNYPITAITSTTVGGVSGVLVDYDDGNSGQLFFADGAGLNTVKSAIELTIPHDTSELTNGAGFLTISDLPIYNGGVQ